MAAREGLLLALAPLPGVRRHHLELPDQAVMPLAMEDYFQHHPALREAVPIAAEQAGREELPEQEASVPAEAGAGLARLREAPGELVVRVIWWL